MFGALLASLAAAHPDEPWEAFDELVPADRGRPDLLPRRDSSRPLRRWRPECPMAAELLRAIPRL